MFHRASSSHMLISHELEILFIASVECFIGEGLAAACLQSSASLHVAEGKGRSSRRAASGDSPTVSWAPLTQGPFVSCPANSLSSASRLSLQG